MDEPNLANLHRIREQHGMALMERYRACQPYYSADIWVTITLRHEQGMTVAAVAEKLGRASSTISGRLKRARELLEAKEAELRREAYELRRTFQEE